MADQKLTREDCIRLLRETADSLSQSGETRYPKRSDYPDATVMAIKAFLGPWPRALEAAGLKPPRDGDRLQKNREKRIAAKRKLNALRKERKKNPENTQKKEEEK